MNFKKLFNKLLIAVLIIFIVILLIIVNKDSLSNNSQDLNNSDVYDVNNGDLENKINVVQSDSDNSFEFEDFSKANEINDSENENSETFSYWVNFIDDDGIVLQRSIFKQGSLPSFDGPLPSKIVNDYKYTFNNWTPNIDIVNGTQVYVASYIKTYIGDNDTNTISNPIPEDSKCTVIFDVQGKGTAPSSVEIDKGDKIISPSNPTYTDYVFKGWYEEPECINEWNFSNSINSNKTLYAKWISETSEKILNAKTIYTDGENNLTDNDVITINGVDCYVLQVDQTNNKAELITKNIYDVRFDDGGHSDGDVMNYVGGNEGSGDYSDKTYRYDYSTLKTWMDNFYINYLGSNSKILDTTIGFYYKNSFPGEDNESNLSLYSNDSVSQKCFTLDASEAKINSSKFKWTFNPGTYNMGFWISAGFLGEYKYSNSLWIGYNGYISNGSPVNYAGVGSRPAFWINLD